MLLFTTLELGPTSQKGTPFWVHFGDLFSKKNEKRGFQKRPENQSPKTLKMGPKPGGGAYLREMANFLTSEPCSDPLCCWNAPGRPFFTILASLFLHFCVAARYKEQPFSKKTNKGGSRQELKFTSKRTRKMRPILGGALMKHFPSAVHWETREAALPRRRRLGYLARHESTRSWRGTVRGVPAEGTFMHIIYDL